MKLNTTVRLKPLSVPQIRSQCWLSQKPCGASHQRSPRASKKQNQYWAERLLLPIQSRTKRPPKLPRRPTKLHRQPVITRCDLKSTQTQVKKSQLTPWWVQMNRHRSHLRMPCQKSRGRPRAQSREFYPYRSTVYSSLSRIWIPGRCSLSSSRSTDSTTVPVSCSSWLSQRHWSCSTSGARACSASSKTPAISQWNNSCEPRMIASKCFM